LAGAAGVCAELPSDGELLSLGSGHDLGHLWAVVNADVLYRKIRMRQLRCFVTVARKGSFVHAADELALTQPAVSRSVRELEQLIGVDLFDRSQRGAKLTHEGEQLLEAAELGLMQISQGVRAAATPDQAVDRLAIGALPNVCSQILPPIVAALKEAHPRSTIAIQPGTNADLLDGLRRGASDVVIGRLSHNSDMKGLSFEHLFDEPLIFVVDASHPLIGADASLSLRAAMAYPFLLPPEGTIIRQEVNRFLILEGLSRPSNVIETTSSDFQRAYLRATDCVAVVPKGVVQPEIEKSELYPLPIQGEALSGPVGITTNPEAKATPLVGEFIKAVRAVF